MDTLKSDFLAQKHIAVVGVSRTRGFGNSAFRRLKQLGYQVYPVNSRADEVEGERCFHGLGELPIQPEAVLAIVPPAETEKLVEECGRLGISRLWMQQGAESTTALKRCEALGIHAVHHACILMYAAPTGVHRFHGAVCKLLGKY
jgi:predicted CoA-binding protein